MRFILRCLIAASCILVFLGSAQAQPVTIGETAVLSGFDGGNGNLLAAQSATLAETATIESLSFYIAAASGNLILGIYDATGPNGGPGALKATSASFTPRTGWNTAKVATSVSLAAGTYWLAYLPSSSSLGFVKTNASGNCAYYSYQFGALPSKFSTSPASCTPATWSFYATLTASSSGTTTSSGGTTSTGTTAVNGTCGSSNAADLTSKPTANLCSAGTASSVSGSGPWNWTCAGSDGGTAARCSALLETAGACGSANGGTVSSTPTTNLCSAGTASTVTGAGPWLWTCAGSNGGATASCSDNKLASTGSTGSSGSGTSTSSSKDPTVGLLPASSDGYANWNVAGMKGIPLTGSISGTTLSVTYSPSLALGPGQTISGSGVASGTQITAFGSGTGGAGTYTVSASQTVASETMMASGIPNRTTIYKTLSPSGGDDTAAINSALAGCPAGQVVLLTTGVFKISGVANGIVINNGGCTLRGSGPGSQHNTGIMPVGQGVSPTSVSASCSVQTNRAIATYCPDATGTQLIIYDLASGGVGSVINTSAYRDITHGAAASYNLASDAVQGTYTITLSSTPSVSPGNMVYLDEDASSNPGGSPPQNGGDPNFNYTSFTSPSSGIGNLLGYGLRGAYRIPSDIMEVASVSGNTVTLDTPITYPYHVSNHAQLSTYKNSWMRGLGIENMFLFGGPNGGMYIETCAYCWVKNVETTWQYGIGLSLFGVFHNEVRDSFVHEEGNVHSGGGGYLMALDGGSSESLFENNISWLGDKPIVMRGAGGGNVFAYNYTDDTFNFDNPSTPEAGLNASHLVGTHLALLEGNYGQNFTQDDYWGNSVFTTVFRNWLSAHRARAHQVYNYTFLAGGCPYPTADLIGVAAVNVQAYSGGSNVGSPGAGINFVGNVLGTRGQTLATYMPGCTNPMNSFQEQVTTTAENNADGNSFNMWYIGGFQNTYYGNPWVDTTVSDTQLVRLFNWDFVTTMTDCFATGGITHVVCPTTAVPNSFYLSSTPAFLGAHPWPWVNPATGTAPVAGNGSTVYTVVTASSPLLPAKYCFEQNKMPTCSLP
jgi:hypothetical protein